METENKALLISHSLELCVKNQTPIILEEKVLTYHFTPWLLRTEPLCRMLMPEQTQLHRQQDISLLITKSTCCLKPCAEWQQGSSNPIFKFSSTHSGWMTCCPPQIKDQSKAGMFLSSRMEISDATTINFHSSGSVPCLLLAITVGSRMSLKTGGKDSCLVVLFTFSHKQPKAEMIMHILIN